MSENVFLLYLVVEVGVLSVVEGLVVVDFKVWLRIKDCKMSLMDWVVVKGWVCMVEYFFVKRFEVDLKDKDVCMFLLYVCS